MLQLCGFLLLSFVYKKLSFGLFEHFLVFFDFEIDFVDVSWDFSMKRHFDDVLNLVRSFLEINHSEHDFVDCVFDAIFRHVYCRRQIGRLRMNKVVLLVGLGQSIK